jgi:transposase
MARARRRFSEESKQEAVRLVTVRGVLMAQAARDLSIHVNLLRT